MALVIDGLTKRFEDVQALDGVTFTVQEGEILGFLGANGAGKTTTMRIVLGFLRADAGHGDLERPRHPGVAAPNLGLHARGAWPLHADAGPRPARVLRIAVRPEPDRDASGRPRLARPVPDRRIRRPEGGDPLEGQPAEGPVHRDRPPRPRRAAHGRAVRRPRPDQRGPPQVRLPRASRSRQDAGLQHPPARPGGGAVRLGGDHRPRPDRHLRADPRGEALDRPPGRPGGDRRRTATLPGCGRCRTSRSPARARTSRRSGSTPARTRRPFCGPPWPGAAKCCASRWPTRPSRRSSSSGSARSTSRSGRWPLRRSGHERPRQHQRRRAPRVHRPGPDPELRLRHAHPARRRPGDCLRPDHRPARSTRATRSGSPSTSAQPVSAATRSPA